MMNCIEIKGITKDFKNTRALNNVNLTFEENKIYGLLGRNGAGKTAFDRVKSGRNKTRIEKNKDGRAERNGRYAKSF